MCGIVGVSFHNEAKITDQTVRRKVVSFLFTRLLRETQDRGEDATGVAALYSNGWWMTMRDAVKSEQFICGIRNTEDKTREVNRQEVTYGNYLQMITEGYTNHGPSDPTILLGHCRKKTQGSEFNMVNNHPITIPESDVICIHNGSVKNDAKIFEKLKVKRCGEVDSEALARLFEHELKEAGDNPLTLDNMYNIGHRYDGYAAALMVSGKHPDKLFGVRETRPLYLYNEKNLGVIFYISDSKFMEAAMASYHHVLISLAPEFPDLEFGVEEVSDRTVFIVDLTKSVDKAVTATDFPYAKDSAWATSYTAAGSSSYNNTSNQSTTHKDKSLYSSERIEARREIESFIEDREKVLNPPIIAADDSKFEFVGGSEDVTKIGSSGSEAEAAPFGEDDAGEDIDYNTVDMEKEGLLPTENKMANAKKLSELYKEATTVMIRKLGSGQSLLNYPMSTADVAKLLDVTEHELKNCSIQALVAGVFQLAAKSMFVEGYEYCSREGEESSAEVDKAELTDVVRALRLILLSAIVTNIQTGECSRTVDNVKEEVENIREVFTAFANSDTLIEIGNEFLDKIGTKEADMILKAISKIEFEHKQKTITATNSGGILEVQGETVAEGADTAAEEKEKEETEVGG